MTENNEDKKLTLGSGTLRAGTLGLKKNVGPGTASGVQARPKGVTVEVRKKRVFSPEAGKISDLSNLSEEDADSLTKEQEYRLRILKEALKADDDRKKEDERRKVEEEARKRAAEEERKAREKEQAEKLAKLTPEDREIESLLAVGNASGPAKKPKEEKKKDETSPEVHINPAPPSELSDSRREWDVKKKFKTDAETEFKTARLVDDKGKKVGEDRRRSGKITLTSVLSSGDEEGDGGRRRSQASMRRAREKERMKSIGFGKPAEKVFREVILPETITIQELASRMSERGADVVKVLMKMGVMATITQTIDADTAELVVAEMGHRCRRVSESDVEEGLKSGPDKEEDLLPRPPVVTVMGHVDHGKTSLLDALRSTHVAEGEAGGITQHIGAYQVTMADGQKVTFIDTPGHAAFTEMRARGAKVTDIVILVVAANDGVMPQTIEAIHHAKAAKVPIVVAINKIDVPGANPEKVKTELLQHEIVLESLGGDVLAVEISAKKRINLDKLVEAVLLQAEVLDLKANPSCPAEAVVVEAKMEKGRGSVATVLVQKGTLQAGDIFIAGNNWGRVRALVNDKGQKIDSAGPSVPVEVVGLQSTPAAGDDFIVVSTEEKARQIASYRQRKEREALQVKTAKSPLEQMFAKIKAGEVKEFPVIVKADMQGSVEALTGTLSKIASSKVRINVIHAAVGGINESDVTLARASGAVIIGFNVRANAQAREQAKRDSIDIRYYSIIYDIADDMKKALEGLLAPELKEKIIGYAQIRQIFNNSKIGKIAGCMVTEGIIRRGAKVRLLRDNVVIHTGNLAQLKRFKDDVREVREAYECGISFESYNDIQVNDMIECFEIEEIAAKLEIGSI